MTIIFSSLINFHFTKEIYTQNLHESTANTGHYITIFEPFYAARFSSYLRYKTVYFNQPKKD